jgi:ABC-type polysaccharide/polyol phosphate export permease
VKHFVGIAIQALFYSAPIVYPITLVPKYHEVLGVNVPVRFIYNLNPLVCFIQGFRNVLYDLRFPPLVSMLYMVLWTVGSLGVGLMVFRRLEPRLAEEV